MLRDRRAARTSTTCSSTPSSTPGSTPGSGSTSPALRPQRDGIGLALLAAGVPGFPFGPVIGRLADCYDRAHLNPLGLAAGALAAFLLVPTSPLSTLARSFQCVGEPGTGPDCAHDGGRAKTPGANERTLPCEDRTLSVGRVCEHVFVAGIQSVRELSDG
jgi:hypothetical protein